MKKALPIILIAGAAILFMSMRRRPRVTVTADSPEIQSGAEFEADYQATVKPSLIDAGTKLISNLFPKKTAQQKAAKKAQKVAVKRAVKTGISKKKAKAVTKSLAQGIRFGAAISDDQVLC